MNLITKRPGPLVSQDQLYQTDLGTFSRFDLYDKYAQTVQGCLCWGASDYAPHSGAELIMRTVIAMLNPTSVKQGIRGAFHKLEMGLNRIGYKLVPDDGTKKPDSIIPKLYLGINGCFPGFADQFKDDKTGEPIGGRRGLLHYLNIIDACLEHSERYQYDKVVQLLVQAVKILAEPDPDWRTEEVESLLWQAAKTLGCRLEVVDWYRKGVALE